MDSNDARRILDLAWDLLREVRGPDVPCPELDDDFERALGLDSLGRMELMLRIERAFGVRLPEGAVQDAATPRDLWHALEAAVPQGVAAAPTDTEDRARMTPPTRQAAAASPPRHVGSLVDVLRWHADRTPQRRHLTLLHEPAMTEPWSYADLWNRACAAAAVLRARGLRDGETVALMLPTGFAFFEAFMGTLVAGGVPVPVYPPSRPSQIEEHLRRQAGILANAHVALLVCDPASMRAARLLKLALPHLRGLLACDDLRGLQGRIDPLAREGSDTALVQYTSGSTGDPKGVVLSHANLLANVRAMGEAVRASANDVFVSWLPLYHDMGLIGAWLASMYHAIPLVVMPPQAFLAQPARWLRAISDFRGTLSAAPNFAYEILASRVRDEDLRDLDLRSWRVAFNGAEPVSPATLERFAHRFAGSGFDAHALTPVYGLAESAVGLAFPTVGRGPRIDVIDREALRRDGHARGAEPGAQAMQVVGCGSPLPGHEIRVIGASGQELPERDEGRIEFRGPSATAGYFQRPDATRALFHEGWLDTGDVGYVADGELFITSRAKDIIIRGGQHLHPYEVEEAIGAMPGVRRGCVAVFAASDPHGGPAERVVLIAETRTRGDAARATLRRCIAERTVAVLGVPADDIVLAPPRTILKTSSGKIRRAACRKLYEDGLLGRPTRAVPVQVARLWAAAVALRARAATRVAGEIAQTGWLWSVFILGALAAACAALLPAARRKAAVHAVAQAALRASLLPVTVEGKQPGTAGPCVIVSNHASYVDALLLMALLPAKASFVAKRELGSQAPLRWLLRRLGTHLVDRDDVQVSLADAERLVRCARSGETLVFFPEGTFVRAPGLHAFHMGAFMTAGRAGVPVLPVALSGTRSVLRDGSWRPRREPVRVSFGTPLHPRAEGWAEAVRLRDAARQQIASACAEPLVPDLLVPRAVAQSGA